MNKRPITIALVGMSLLSAFLLAGCGNTDSGNTESGVTGGININVPTNGSTPTPTSTVAVPGDDVPEVGQVYTKDANGVITLPDGTIADCDKAAIGARITAKGYACVMASGSGNPTSIPSASPSAVPSN